MHLTSKSLLNKDLIYEICIISRNIKNIYILQTQNAYKHDKESFIESLLHFRTKALCTKLIARTTFINLV